MPRILRAALVETVNAYAPMPPTIERLDELADRLDQVREANVEHAAELIEIAARAGVELVCMSELFTAPYFASTKNPMWLAMAEDALEGPTVTHMRSVARDHRVIVVAPIYELDSTSGKRFNTAVVIDADGSLLGRYRKTHIPCGSNELGSFYETFYYERSDGNLGAWPANISGNRFFPVFETSKCKLGVAICYDRHFPGTMAALAEHGAELVVCPAVTFGAKSARMWHMEFEVDAARHNLLVGGSNRRGVEPPWNQEYFGASYFSDPRGRIATIDVHPNLVVADLDLDVIGRPDPSGWDLGRDRRPEIY